MILSIVTLPRRGSRAASILWLHHTRNRVQSKKTKVIFIYTDVLRAWRNILYVFEKVFNGFKPTTVITKRSIFSYVMLIKIDIPPSLYFEYNV